MKGVGDAAQTSSMGMGVAFEKANSSCPLSVHRSMAARCCFEKVANASREFVRDASWREAITDGSLM